MQLFAFQNLYLYGFMKKFWPLLVLVIFSCAEQYQVVRRPAGTPAPAAAVSGMSEFDRLMEKDRINKKQVTAEVLTYLLNEPDAREPRTAAVIENKSFCPMILRMKRSTDQFIYSLPIPAQSKNQFVIEKGYYQVSSRICQAHYLAEKEITEPLILILSDH